MKKVPELRFDGFDGERKEKKFSENFDTTIPKNSLSRDKLTNQVTRVKNIHYGDIHKIFDNVLQSSNERIPHIINDDLSTHERYFLQDGDIIFTDAAEDNTAGKCVELEIDDGSNIVAGLHTIPARPIKFGKYFYGFYLNSNSFHNKIVPLLEGTKVSSISKSNLNTLSVIVPKVEEQEKIGDLFRKLDELIEIQEGKVSKIRDFKKSMLQKMFPKKDELFPEFRFDGFDGEWEDLSIGDKYEVTMGQSPKSENYTSDTNSMVLVQGNADLENGRVTPRIYTKEVTKTSKKGDILMTVRAPVGTLAINEYDVVIGRGVCSIKGNTFLYYSLTNKNLNNYWNRFSSGSTFESINSSDIKNAGLKKPSISEQKKIGNFFKNLDTQIENEEKLLDSYKMMKKSLLQKMFV